jgi:hypothetical protein
MSLKKTPRGNNLALLLLNQIININLKIFLIINVRKLKYVLSVAGISPAATWRL